MTVDVRTKEPGAVEAQQLTRASDRRRPGRSGHAAPPLIGLLRGQASSVDASREVEKPLRAAQGIMVGTVMGLALWAGLISGIKHFLG